MNLRNLRTFVAIADTGGMSRALPQLHLSQPAASRQIDALEEELGVQLFERSGRGIRLTSSGADLLRRGRAVLNEADSLRERARALASGRAGLLRVGATPQVMENPLAAYLAVYRRRFPEVEVRLLEEGGARLPDRVFQGDVHLAIVPAGDERLEARSLFPMYLIAVVPRGHRLSNRKMLDISELGSDPIMVGTGFASRVWFETACSNAHFRPNVVLESAAPHTMIALARNHFAIAVLPSSVSVTDRDLRAVPLLHARRAIGRWAAAAWNDQHYLPPYAERFIDGLAKRCTHSYPGRALSRHIPPLPRPRDRGNANGRGGP